jgi:hypothetical protein
MTEPEDREGVDDTQVRRGLACLREDVDALPLSDPGLVRSRGEGRRRLARAAWLAGGAAAAVTVVAVALSATGQSPPDRGIGPATPPPSASTRPSPAPTPSAPATSSPAPSPSPPGPSADDEQMPRVGTQPLLPSSLFVAASQWSSAGLSGGAATAAAIGDWEGQASVAPCDPDTAQDGGAGAGRFGIVSVADADAQRFFGQQRVRLLESAAAAEAEARRLQGAFAAGCTFPNGTVTSTPGKPGSYRLEMTFKDGSAELVLFVGVTTQRTPGAVSTVVVTALADQEAGFAEVERLLALAAQK